MADNRHILFNTGLHHKTNRGRHLDWDLNPLLADSWRIFPLRIFTPAPTTEAQQGCNMISRGMKILCQQLMLSTVH